MSKYGDSLPLKLTRARDIAMTYFRPVLAEHQITEQQWRILRVLDTKGALSFSQLSKESSILGPSLTGIVSRLEKQELLLKKKSEHDGRQFSIHLTDKAEQLVERLRPEIEQQYAVLKSQLGKEKYAHLSSLLDELLKLSD